MRDVLPIEPALRRRDRALRPPVRERGVAIPLHVEVERAIPRRAPTVSTVVSTAPSADANPALSERALAARVLPVIAAVVAVDLATKAWAVAALATQSAVVTPWLSLSLAFNRGTAGGMMLGEYTQAINFTTTGIVVGLLLMLAPALVRLDRRSWLALALVAGAGLGNMASVATDGRGVPDFIALHRANGDAWVLNVADVVLVIGLALLARTILMLIRSVRRREQHVVLR